MMLLISHLSANALKDIHREVLSDIKAVVSKYTPN